MATLQDALSYARAGVPVFPLTGKQPIEHAGKENIDGLIIPPGKGGFHQATVDEAKIERWWAAYPDANIGTPTGYHTDAMTGEPNAKPFDVLDIDLDHGGTASIRALMREHEPLPDTTPMQITGSGGFHYLFASGSHIRNSAGAIAPGIDVRGTGGYIVLAPSIHPNTLEPYEWGEGLSIFEAELAEWPAWLLGIIKESQRKRNAPQPGATIPLGMQEATLMRVAGAMRRHGATKNEIYAALRVIAQERCEPIVADKDVERMAASASNYDPGNALIDFPIDDAGNAERLVMRYGENIRHLNDAQPDKGWLYFDGKVWQESTAKVIQYQLETARAYQDAVRELPEADAEQVLIKRAHTANAKNMAQERGMGSARKLAASFPEIDIARSELDADPWLFACANGVIDLRTGELGEHKASHMITRQSPVAYEAGARSELWDSFLHWLTAERQDLADFLQEAVGYSLTADVREEKLFFIHGPAASGKTTFIEAVKSVVGEYASTADFSTFLKQQNVGGPRPDIARMSGARFVSSVEVDQGRALAEGLVKQMTGGDTITARFLYGSDFEYTATHKLWLVANDAPKVNSEDDGLWRRILRIPCENVVPEGQRDATLKIRLKDTHETGPAILAWAVQGAIRWLERGKLAIPASIKDATDQYRESQDPIVDFVSEFCEVDPKAKVPFGDLWSAYLAWCKQYHRRPMGKLVFGDRLEAKGYKRARNGKGRFIEGLMISSSEYMD